MYNITNLTQVADCNTLLAWATREKANLAYKKTTDERLTERFAETSQEIDAELQSVNADLMANESMINILPEGHSRDETINKKTRLEYRKFVLETRRESYGVVSLLEKQLDLSRINQEIGEVDAFVTAVETQKATL